MILFNILKHTFDTLLSHLFSCRGMESIAGADTESLVQATVSSEQIFYPSF